MNIRLASRTLAIALFCSPFAIQSCYAARIYNNLDTTITVNGSSASGLLGGPTSVKIGPKQRSASLEWTNVTEVYVTGPVNNILLRFSARSSGQRPLPVDQILTVCDVGFGAHARIQGGNYMVVSPPQNGVSCAVYDSNHHLIASGG